MKIAQILDKFLPVTESWIYSQIKGLEKIGFESDIFCHKIINTDSFSHKTIYSYKDAPKCKINYYRALGRLMKKDGAILFWNKYIKNGNFDLVHSHFGWAAQKGIDLAIRNNLPHIATFYGADVTRDPFDPDKKDYQNKLPLIFDYSKRILCTSNFLKINLIKLGAPKDKIQVWRPAIKIDIPKVEKTNDDIFRIISVGRFIDWKGQRFLIKALPIILQKYKNIEVNFVGSGPELEKCKQLAQDLKVDNKINFWGKLPNYSDVIKKMAEADVIVHSSYTADRGVNDALGVVLAEAAMCSTPAIASNSGGIPEIVVDGITGLLVEEKNEKDIADKILLLSNNKILLENLSRDAKIFSSKLFNYNKQINKLFNIIYAKRL